MTQPTINHNDDIVAALYDIAEAIRETAPEGPTHINVSALDASLLTAQSVPLSGDPIDEPSHYKRNGHECLEFTRDLDFLWGNAVKYIWRCLDKGNAAEDVRKARRYITEAIDDGVDKPMSAGRAEVLWRFFVNSKDGTAEEARDLLLFRIFSIGESRTGVSLLSDLELLLERVEEGK